MKSQWNFEGENLHYNIEANRFLRGMVRLLTGTLLKLGRARISFNEFTEFFEANRNCGFSTPAHGLYLNRVSYSENFFRTPASCFTQV
jgi:tRNA pseudouridine38-40 synthase